MSGCRSEEMAEARYKAAEKLADARFDVLKVYFYVTWAVMWMYFLASIL